MRGRGLLALALLLATIPSSPGASPLPELRAEFWTDLDGIGREGEDYPLGDAEAARRILDEAAWVFSGMVAGFDFSWTPANKTRQVAESFTLTPAGALDPGDARLRPEDAHRDHERMRAWIEFHPDEADLRLLEVSLSATWKSAQGRGSVDRWRGFEGRRAAYVEAIRGGIETWARSVSDNRPALVRGRVVLAAVPSLAIVSGAYLVQARLRLEVSELEAWTIW